MKITKMSAAALAAPMVLLSGTALADGDGWITNMDKAMQIAAADSKAILMDFTGSDWCGWCIRLNEEVFSQSMWQEYANQNLVLVELDFPRGDILTKEQVAHNTKWRDKVGIEGYPTIILADEHGDEFARTGYVAGGPANYVDHIGELLTGKEVRDAALAAADKVDGIARAKMLDWALSIEGISVPNSDVLIEEIIALDNKNTAGLRDLWTLKLNDRKADAEFQSIQRTSESAEAAVAAVDALLAKYELSGEKYGELYGFRIMVLAQSGKADEALAGITEFLARDDMNGEAKQQVSGGAINLYLMQENYDAAVEAFENTINYAPGSEYGKMLAGQKADFLDYVKKSREGTLESIPATKMTTGGDDDK